MSQRAMDEEKARKQREVEDFQREQEQAAREAQELQAQIIEDVMRQLLASATGRSQSRRLAWCTRRTSVRRREHDPPARALCPLSSPLTRTITPHLKIKRVEAEIQRLTAIRHQNLVSVFTVKLNVSHSSGPPQLAVLSEQPPALSLHDLLEDCDSLREERATDCLAQILSALNAVHAGGLTHRGITVRCISLSSRDPQAQTQTKQLKLAKVGYYTLLLDLHCSTLGIGTYTPLGSCCCRCC
ncbi:hypothetical protein AX14_001770 [Amanita brunnescens Koide BX004]|nr:hypothetical protein AX14_001770 [Amanita brunnescens Koide BX004]